MPAQSKIDQVQEIVSHLDSSLGMFVVNYNALTVKQSQELRRELRANGAEMKVYKNNLVKIALEQKEMPALDEILVGPVAYIFYENDPVEPAKILRDFTKKNKTMEIKGGISDGKAVNAAEVNAIADLPSRDQLLSMFLQASLGPATGAVRVINGPIQGLINVLDAIKDQKEAA